MATAVDVVVDPLAWLDDPDVVAAEFAALIEANFPAEPPDTKPDGPSGRPGFGSERGARRRKLSSVQDGASPGSGVAHERSPPV